MFEGRLYEAESETVGRMVPKRRREFTAGRVAARTAMVRLGFPAAPIPIGPSRQPLWPEGVIGSISHCDETCIVAVAPKGRVTALGLDVEKAAPLPSDIEHLVLTRADTEAVREAGAASEAPDWLGRLVFSAKESLYKCWYPVEGTFLGFQEASLSLDIPGGRWLARIEVEPSRGFPPSLPGRFFRKGELIVTAVSLAPGP
jgi:4'-phosphopantetheinyl transferase EntD